LLVETQIDSDNRCRKMWVVKKERWKELAFWGGLWGKVDKPGTELTNWGILNNRRGQRLEGARRMQGTANPFSRRCFSPRRLEES